MGRAFAIAFSALLIVVSCGPLRKPWAEAQAPSPTAEIKQSIDQALAALKEGAPSEAELLARLRKILEPQVDFEEMGRRVLGRHYPPNRHRMSEFLELFRQFLERRYVQRVWLEEGKGVSVSYRGETVGDSGSASVRITITTAKGVDVPVEFRLHRASLRWLVYDILIENFSLVSNYRTQFNKILAQRSFDELLAQMRQTIAQAEAAERQAERRR